MNYLDDWSMIAFNRLIQSIFMSIVCNCQHYLPYRYILFIYADYVRLENRDLVKRLVNWFDHQCFD